MIVQKFGGTSVGSAQRMKAVAELIANGDTMASQYNLRRLPGHVIS